MAELNALTVRRGQLKGQLTRFSNFVQSVTEQDINVIQLKLRMEKIKEVFQDFESVQTSIEEIAMNEETEKYRVDFEDLYFESVADCESLIIKITDKKLNKNSFDKENCENGNINDNSDGHSISINTSNPSNFMSMVKLAPLEIQNFTGIYSEWAAFHDIFSALVHKNSSLTEIQKFFYLRSSLSGDASKTIQFLETTSDNYKIAWDALISRYSNKKLAVQIHTKKLFDLESMTDESSVGLRKLVDAVNGHMKALTSLGQNPKEWGSLLLHLISIKLDANTLKQWEIESSKAEVASVNRLIEYLENRCQVLEAIEASSGLKIVPSQLLQFKKNKFQYKKTINDKSSSFIVTGTLKCFNCNGAHTIYKCSALLALTIADRIKRISELKLCKICLRNHAGEKCMSRRCAKCMKAHNSLLHIPKSQTSTAGGAENATMPKLPVATVSDPAREQNVIVHESISAHSSRQSPNKQILLSTAVVIVRNSRGEATPCRVLLDTGSQSNFMTESMSQILKLNKTRVSCTIVGINQSAHTASYMVSANIESRVSDYKINIEFYILQRLTGNIPLSKVNVSKFQIPTELKLADPSYSEPQKIDAILGSEVFYDLIRTNQFKFPECNLTMQETHLGWIVAGSTQVRANVNKTSTVALCTSISKLEQQISNFWRTEEISSTTVFTLEEKACRKHFENTVQRDEHGRFIVQLPFRSEVLKLGDSKSTAMRRFQNLEKRFLSSPKLKGEYLKFMKEYEDLGHMTKTEYCPDKQKDYYLPHHAVWKEDSVTTKLRVVFDASCKTTSGMSLNDALLKGPCIQEDLVNLLTRFRKHRYAMTADISKMYRRIWVAPNHRTYQRIFWRANIEDDHQVFLLNTVTYGTVPASFLATGCLHRLANEESTAHPEACNAIKQDFYMDDYLGGAESLHEAIKLRDEIIKVLRKGGFELRKWTACDPELLNGLANTENDPTLILDLSENSAKILGLRWEPADDIFTYKVKLADRENFITKRKVLSEIATIFDPLGLISPVVIKAKIKMQRLWSMGIGWDDPLPESSTLDWYEFRESLLSLNELFIPRCIVVTGEIVDVQIHGFSDASIEAYGACLYLVTANSQDERVSRLICAKSRVAPLKSISLPRLELCGAVLLARLANKIIPKLRMNINRKSLWTDSEIVLAWISSPSAQWKTFVAHRVGEIQEITSISEWSHVNTNDNPADIISRGQEPGQLLVNEFWWEGPRWLKYDSAEWPAMKKKIDSSTTEERRTINLVSIEQSKWSLLSRYSNLNQLLRVVALCLRFAFNVSHPEDKRTGTLLAEDLTKATSCLVRAVQREHWSREISDLTKTGQCSSKSNIFRLRPYLDENNIIRVGGRLKNADHLSICQKNPMLLPSNNCFTYLIFQDAHEILLHGGPQLMLAHVRQRFWPINGRNIARKISFRCVRCFRLKPVVYQPIMGNLPKPRVEPSRPFSVCGVDFAGPLMIKTSLRRNSAFSKGYMCVFVCFSTKAVHIELVGDLTTTSFISALRRFCDRRGKCSDIYSDNAKNFVGANRQLVELSKLFNNEEHQSKLQDVLSESGIRWHFIPPRSPHFGGLWESAIKSIKHHLFRALGNAYFTYEELNTILIRVEACLNSRPLTPLSSDPTDLAPLTPGHFLIGDALTALPEMDVSSISTNRLTRWRRVMQVSQQLWSRWSREYLAQLQERKRWCAEKGPKVKVGSIVLVKDDNIPPLQWKLGIVQSLHVNKGNDGVPRVATVKTSHGVYLRAIRYLCPLPFEENISKINES